MPVVFVRRNLGELENFFLENIAVARRKYAYLLVTGGKMTFEFDENELTLFGDDDFIDDGDYLDDPDDDDDDLDDLYEEGSDEDSIDEDYEDEFVDELDDELEEDEDDFEEDDDYEDLDYFLGDDIDD